jgi:hypothetical protein
MIWHDKVTIDDESITSKTIISKNRYYVFREFHKIIFFSAKVGVVYI